MFMEKFSNPKQYTTITKKIQGLKDGFYYVYQDTLHKAHTALPMHYYDTLCFWMRLKSQQVQGLY